MGYTNVRGQRFILIINEALYFPDMENSLMNPNQLRDFGVDVEDNPYGDKPMIISKQDQDDGDFVAALKLTGTTIYIYTWTPTREDLQDYPHIVLTSSHPWNPSKVQMPTMSSLEIKEVESVGISKAGVSQVGGVNHIYSDPYLEPMMKSEVIPECYSDGPLSEHRLMEPKTFLSKDRHSNMTPEDLSEV